MNWTDALQISTLVLTSLGGGGAVVFGLSRFLADKWLQDWKGEIDTKLTKLEASLQHRNYLLQRLAEFELEAVTECWRSARACLPLINATRPFDSGIDEGILEARYSGCLRDIIGCLRLSASMKSSCPFAVIGALDALGRVVRLELSNIRHHEHFDGDWWEQGQRTERISSSCVTPFPFWFGRGQPNSAPRRFDSGAGDPAASRAGAWADVRPASLKQKRTAPTERPC